MLAFIRGTRLVIHLLVGLILALALKLDRKNRLEPGHLMSWWCSVTLGILNVQLNINGEPPPGARLTVANHVSWLDIIVIGACEPTRFVSKSEVRDWPVAGWLAEACCTFYIRRGKGGARPLVDKLVPHLAEGGTVTVFPEGTTTDGRQVLPFHPRLFAAAVESQSPVQPLAIRYGLSSTGASIVPFIGDDDLVSHVLRLLKEPELLAEVSYCAPIRTADLTRELLAQAAQTSIEQVILPSGILEAQTELQTALI